MRQKDLLSLAKRTKKEKDVFIRKLAEAASINPKTKIDNIREYHVYNYLFNTLMILTFELIPQLDSFIVVKNGTQTHLTFVNDFEYGEFSEDNNEDIAETLTMEIGQIELIYFVSEAVLYLEEVENNEIIFLREDYLG